VEPKTGITSNSCVIIAYEVSAEIGTRLEPGTGRSFSFNRVSGALKLIILKKREKIRVTFQKFQDISANPTICSTPPHAPAGTPVQRGAIPGNVPPTDDLGRPQTHGRPLRVRKVGATAGNIIG
jgi:hypothetical protein